MSGDSHRASIVEELPEHLSLHKLVHGYRNEPYLGLLESSGSASKLARYSFLGTNPFYVFYSKRTECFGGPPGKMQKLPGTPFAELQELLKRFRADTQAWAPGLPPFLGGAIGYLGYEMLYLLENVPDLGKDDLALPDCYLMFCDTALASDKHEGRSWIAASGIAPTHEEATRHAASNLARAKARLSEAVHEDEAETTGTIKVWRAELKAVRPRLGEEHLLSARIKAQLSRAQYLQVVETAKEHIFSGDIFEVCTTNRFDTQFSGQATELYRSLRAINEAPFSAYLRFPEAEVVCSSPERFVKLDRDGWAETCPIKGTRPRGATSEEDERQWLSLKTCAKDQAENMIVVDLGRNDLGRVCQFGTVTVPELRVIESYPLTHQLMSTVRGKLRPNHDAVDLIRATFPGGSMTGAPKIEAMKVIDRLEPVKRGIFSGSIGYIDFDGAFDLNIVIRTFIKKGEHLSFHVGGAIVAESDPAEEYQETLDKAHGLVAALEFARGA